MGGGGLVAKLVATARATLFLAGEGKLFGGRREVVGAGHMGSYFDELHSADKRIGFLSDEAQNRFFAIPSVNDSAERGWFLAV
jgi:hypothetical protein